MLTNAHKALGWIPGTIQTMCGSEHLCSHTWEVKAEESKVQRQPIPLNSGEDDDDDNNDNNNNNNTLA